MQNTHQAHSTTLLLSTELGSAPLSEYMVDGLRPGAIQKIIFNQLG